MYRRFQLESELLDQDGDESEDIHSAIDDTSGQLFDYSWTQEQVHSDRDDMDLESEPGEIKIPDSRSEIGSLGDHDLLTAEQERNAARRLVKAVLEMAILLSERPRYCGLLMESIESQHLESVKKGETGVDCFDELVALHTTMKLHHWMGTSEDSDLAARAQQCFNLSLRKVQFDRDSVIALAQQALEEALEMGSWLSRLESQYNRYLAARDTLVVANIRLVYHVALRFQNKSLDLDDLVQEGILGLIRAAEKFDGEAGFRFSTYGFWWIKQAVRQALANQRSNIRYPFHLNTQITQLYAFEQDYVSRYGSKPSVTQMVKGTGLSSKKIKDLKGLSNFCVSANKTLFEDGAKTLQDDLTYEDGQLSVFSEYRGLEQSDQLRRAMAKLTPRESTVLAMKFGIGHRKAYSLNEIAPQMGVSRERVRQIVEEAVTKLQILLSKRESELI